MRCADGLPLCFRSFSRFAEEQELWMKAAKLSWERNPWSLKLLTITNMSAKINEGLFCPIDIPWMIAVMLPFSHRHKLTTPEGYFIIIAEKTSLRCVSEFNDVLILHFGLVVLSVKRKKSWAETAGLQDCRIRVVRIKMRADEILFLCFLLLWAAGQKSTIQVQVQSWWICRLCVWSWVRFVLLC